jgi:hypothetical protein
VLAKLSSRWQGHHDLILASVCADLCKLNESASIVVLHVQIKTLIFLEEGIYFSSQKDKEF